MPDPKPHDDSAAPVIDPSPEGRAAMKALPYDEAVKVWASRKFDLDLEVIQSVDFDIYTWSGCPTCGPEVDAEVTVRFLDGRRAYTNTFNHSDLGSLIREVLEAAHSDA